jgi:sodium-coupled neutral amino acid transporter 2
MSRKLPSFMSSSKGGQIFWSALFSYGVVLPLTLVRKLSALRFASLFSFFCGIYVVMVLVLICLCNRDITPDLGESLTAATTNNNITATGIFNSFPLIVFSFMYQPNLPSVYQELAVKTP